MLTAEHEQQLLTVARNSIKYGLEKKEIIKLSLADYPVPLREIRATFVTLKIGPALRGCIGTTTAISPLVSSVNDNAYAAAFKDPRFSPLTSQEFDYIRISVSILTPGEPIEFVSERELLNQLSPGIDGLIIEKDNRRATFLPAVWESLPIAEEFLAHLKQKANIKPDQLPDRAWRYQSISISE
jgi:uncharacterized protein